MLVSASSGRPSIAASAAASSATASVVTNAWSVGANTVYWPLPFSRSTSPARTTADCSTSNSPSGWSTISTMVMLPGFAASADSGLAARVASPPLIEVVPGAAEGATDDDAPLHAAVLISNNPIPTAPKIFDILLPSMPRGNTQTLGVKGLDAR